MCSDYSSRSGNDTVVYSGAVELLATIRSGTGGVQETLKE